MKNRYIAALCIIIFATNARAAHPNLVEQKPNPIDQILCMGIKKRSYDIVRCAIEHGANVNITDYNGEAVIMRAFRELNDVTNKDDRQNTEQIIILLLANGANREPFREIISEIKDLAHPILKYINPETNLDNIPGWMNTCNQRKIKNMCIIKHAPCVQTHLSRICTYGLATIVGTFIGAVGYHFYTKSKQAKENNNITTTVQF